MTTLYRRIEAWIPGSNLERSLAHLRPPVPPGRSVSIFVGNLPFRAEQEDVIELFASYGEVVNCSLPLERDTGRKRGFAFVEMADPELETKAIDGLQGTELMGRPLRINKAEPRGGGGGAPRRGGYGGGGGGGGYGGGGGGGYSRSGGEGGGYGSGARGWEDRSGGDRSSDGFDAGRARRRRSGGDDAGGYGGGGGYGGAEV